MIDFDFSGLIKGVLVLGVLSGLMVGGAVTAIAIWWF